MTSPWARYQPEKPTTDRYPASWPRYDAKRIPESVQRRRREYREPEDDPRAEVVGAYLDRKV
jgi:hypothetical protein